MQIKIDKLTISQKNPLIIPEIGINHNGSLEIAKLMVDAAKRAGAKIIKHQTHIVEDEMSQEAKNVIPGNANISIYEIMEQCALNYKDELALKEYVEKQGLVYLSTPFSRAAANRLEDMGVSAYKIGSGECNNYPLIKHIAQFKKPMIISTGMNSIESIKPTVKILRDYEIPFVLLHTTNLYPTPSHLVRLQAMLELYKEFNCLYGLSDHTTNNLACIGAIALGASVLERHFTDTMDRKGPDIVCSMDESTLKDLINQTQEMVLLRGDNNKNPLKEEQVTIDFAFASVVSIKDIKKGEILSIDGFSKFIHEIEPDLIVVHGDRVEPLAAAIVGSLNNILVAHIEGGELSGTIDESLRHAISKLAHIHLVNDEIAKKRLIQMGEDEKSIFIIGSPDLELLNNTISLDEAKKYYDIKFKNYAIAIFHPITTEINSLYKQSEEFVNALIKSEKNYIVIYPNNDLGFELILQNYERLKNNERFKIFPSLRFEYFISLLKNANFIIGNSSCIIKEALYLNINGILVGSRQDGRTDINKTIRVNAEEKDILEAILNTSKCTNITNKRLEILNSSEQFYRLLKNNILFTINKQKIFMDKK